MAGQITSKVSRAEFDELGNAVSANSTAIRQTADRLEVVAEAVGQGQEQVLLEMGGGTVQLTDGSIRPGSTIYLPDIGAAAGTELIWEVYITLSASKNIRPTAMYYNSNLDIQQFYGEFSLFEAGVEGRISYKTTVPVGMTNLNVYFNDEGTNTSGVTAAISYRDGVLKTQKGYVTRSELDITANAIRAEVSAKADGDGSGNAMSIKTAGVEIDANGVLLSAESDDGKGFLRVTDEGVSASSLSAPDVAARYDGPDVVYVNPNATNAQVATGEYVRSLREAISRVNGKCLDKQVEIRLANGTTTYGDVELRGVHGGGGLTLVGSNTSGCVLNGRLTITNCYTLIRMDGISVVTADGNAVTVNGSPDVFFWGDVIESGTGKGMAVGMGGGVYALGCVLSGAQEAASVQMGGRAVFNNTTGSGKLKCDSAVMMASGTVPSGGAQWVNSFEPNNKSSLTTDSTGGTASAVSTTTAEYGMTGSDSYAGGWNYFADNAPKQGYVTGGGRVMGCIWFDNTTIRSALSGKSIKQATLRLHQLGNYGRGVGVSVQLWGTSKAYSASLSGAPALTKSYGTVGSTEPGRDCELTVTDAVKDLANGTISGLVLYSDDTAVYKDRDYSRNYTSYSIEESRKPKLTVVYG